MLKKEKNISPDGFGAVIQNRGFSNLWSNQILVQLAYNSLNFALIIWVFKLTDSNTAVSGLLLAVYSPAVILGLFAGVLVDAMDRKKIFLAIDFMLFLLFLSLVFLKQSYPAILLITFLINSMAQFYTPAESSALPLLVKKDQLLQANSLFSSTLFITFLVGFGLAGPLIFFLGINSVFIIGASSTLLAFLMANSFPSIKSKADKEAKDLLYSIEKFKIAATKRILVAEVRETLGMVRGRMLVLTSIMILAGVQAIVGILGVLIPSFLERVLQISATDASFVLIAPLGIGTILGAILVGRIGHLYPRRVLVGRAISVAGLLLFIVGIAPLISPAIQYTSRKVPLHFIHQPSLSSILIVGSFFLGLALASIIVPSQTVLQENSPEADRGKVFSVLAVAMSAFSIIPVLFAGILSDIFGTMPIFIGLGGLIGLLGLFILRPDFFFASHHLPDHIRELLGLGHWED